mmetsp:Transcript_7841/g.11723  ORF Transcript_7841/g.11723 Transcript_7841/m.11723 type:complete len:110 (+) Transcript_7841:204-533(+)
MYTFQSVKKFIDQSKDNAHFLKFPDLYEDLKDSVSIISIEAAFMIDADDFLGWGVSEVNDVVEHTRRQSGKTYCSAKDRRKRTREEQMSWCTYLQQRQQLSRKRMSNEK